MKVVLGNLNTRSMSFSSSQEYKEIEFELKEVKNKVRCVNCGVCKSWLCKANFEIRSFISTKWKKNSNYGVLYKPFAKNYPKPKKMKSKEAAQLARVSNYERHFQILSNFLQSSNFKLHKLSRFYIHMGTAASSVWLTSHFTTFVARRSGRQMTTHLNTFSTWFYSIFVWICPQ